MLKGSFLMVFEINILNCYSYLEDEFNKLNLHLTEQQLDDLTKQCLTKNIKAFEINLTDEQLSNTKYIDEIDAIDDIKNILLNQGKIEEYLKAINENGFDNLSDRFRKITLKAIYEKKPTYSTTLKKEDEKVIENINDLWGEFLDLFELQINTAIEITKNIEIEKLENYDKNKELYESLLRLQCRACLVSKEILVLLRAGFTDGAYARCRTLYETMVISSFIQKEGNETAKRYLDYRIIDDFKEAKKINDRNEFFEIPLIDDTIFSELELKKNNIILKYNFNIKDNGYPWAFTLKNKEDSKISFVALEEAVKLNFQRAFYKATSNNVHSNASSLYSHMGLPNEYTSKMLMGASSHGIDIPCFEASKCINVTTINLISNITMSMEQEMQILLLFKINEDLGNSYIEVKND